MLEAAQIDRMSTSERLQAMEQLWEALCKSARRSSFAILAWGHSHGQKGACTTGRKPVPDTGTVERPLAASPGMNVVVLEDAAADLEASRAFYERREAVSIRHLLRTGGRHRVCLRRSRYAAASRCSARDAQEQEIANQRLEGTPTEPVCSSRSAVARRPSA